MNLTMIRWRFAYILILQLVCVFSLSAQADFNAGSTEGCTPFSTSFWIDETSVDMDTISRIDWHFGYGDTLTALSADSVIYEQEGLYTVAMVINGDRENAIVKTDFIDVHRTLRAAFQYEEYAPNNNYRFIPVDEISDSAATYNFFWDYNKIDSSDSRNNTYTLNILNQLSAVDSVTLDTGVYIINLTITDNYGCESSFAQRLFLAEEILVPNIFFPDQDEFFIIESRNLNTALTFQVFNRYGLLIFSQTASTINWNGKTNNGDYLSAGVYYYILSSGNENTADRYSQRGFIHLYR